MENVFENAYLGKAYKTRNSNKVIFLYFDYETEPHSYNCWVKGVGHVNYTADGKLFYCGSIRLHDIVGEWEEKIDEDKLRELSVNEAIDYAIPSSWNRNFCFAEGFRIGYRKAKEEK